MGQAYSNPKRESDPHALPDIEVWEHVSFESDDPIECPAAGMDDPEEHSADHGPDCDGWYWWSCFPGCLPDGSASGPFKTEQEALEDARDGVEDEDEDIS